MANLFSADGNLGDNPESKIVEVNGEDKTVASFSVYFDRRRKNKESGEYEDRGGFWLNCDVWGKSAEQAAQLLRKGARVHCSGDMELQEWTDDHGNEQRKFKLHIDSWYLHPMRLESVQYKSSDNSH